MVRLSCVSPPADARLTLGEAIGMLGDLLTPGMAPLSGRRGGTTTVRLSVLYSVVLCPCNSHNCMLLQPSFLSINCGFLLASRQPPPLLS
jgi:hypothetical protein